MKNTEKFELINNFFDNIIKKNKDVVCRYFEIDKDFGITLYDDLNTPLWDINCYINRKALSFRVKNSGKVLIELENEELIELTYKFNKIKQLSEEKAIQYLKMNE